jgi:Holliday junction DNA helicase RuvA
MLTKVPGVGRKTAERLIVDLRERAEEMAASGLIAVPPAAVTPEAKKPQDEVLDALLSLGYKPAEARRMVEQARPANTTTPDLLRAALKTAAPQGRG